MYGNWFFATLKFPVCFRKPENNSRLSLHCSHSHSNQLEFVVLMFVCIVVKKYYVYAWNIVNDAFRCNIDLVIELLSVITIYAINLIAVTKDLELFIIDYLFFLCYLFSTGMRVYFCATHILDFGDNLLNLLSFFNVGNFFPLTLKPLKYNLFKYFTTNNDSRFLISIHNLSILFFIFLIFSLYWINCLEDLSHYHDFE